MIHRSSRVLEHRGYEQRVKTLFQSRVSDGSVPQRCIRHPANHRNLDRRHNLSRAHAETRETEDLVAVLVDYQAW
jgi:hypothetical protein